MTSVSNTILNHIPVDLIELIIYVNKTNMSNRYIYNQLKEIIVKLKSSTIQNRIYNNFIQIDMDLYRNPMYMRHKEIKINKRKPMTIYKSGTHFFYKEDILFKNLPSQICADGYRSWDNNVLDISHPFQITLLSNLNLVYVFYNVKISINGFRYKHSMYVGEYSIYIFDHI